MPQGDIGTSLLYVYSTIFANINLDGQSKQEVKEDVYGAISLIFWTLTLIGLIKYVLVVLRANDTGEGKSRGGREGHPSACLHGGHGPCNSCRQLLAMLLGPCRSLREVTTSSCAR